jgi:hypothetical protein
MKYSHHCWYALRLMVVEAVAQISIRSSRIGTHDFNAVLILSLTIMTNRTGVAISPIEI